MGRSKIFDHPFCFLSFALISISCSDGTFATGGAAKGSDANAKAAGEAHAAGSVKPSGEFFKPGNSLDLYVIMDKSTSLFRDPSSPFVENSGSDPQCKRFDALLDMLDTLRTLALQKEEIRLSIVTFGSGSRSLETVPDVLSAPREQLNEKFRARICSEPSGIQSTYYEKGISASIGQYAKNKETKKLNLESVLFFSDGAAKDDQSLLREQIALLNSTFPNRVFGILLGTTSDTCSLTDNSDKPLSTTECLLEVVGKASERLIKAADASGLSAAMTSLIK